MNESILMMEQLFLLEGIPIELAKKTEFLLKERKVMVRWLELAADKQKELNEVAAQLNAKHTVTKSIEEVDIIKIEDSS